MVVRKADGTEVPVPGESLYRLRDGQVLGVVDYIDPVAYAKLRGDSARTPDFVAGGGSLPQGHTPAGAVADTMRSHVEAMTYARSMAGFSPPRRLRWRRRRGLGSMGFHRSTRRVCWLVRCDVRRARSATSSTPSRPMNKPSQLAHKVAWAAAEPPERSEADYSTIPVQPNTPQSRPSAAKRRLRVNQ